tara:strand:- start:4557 stop:4757 length:201 start_codon:yes stop_codon:yes gene_type:complete
VKADEHRKLVQQHLKYIKERVDDNAAKLDRLNGRVRKNEKELSFIKGIGTVVTFILGGIIGWFEIK